VQIASALVLLRLADHIDRLAAMLLTLPHTPISVYQSRRDLAMENLTVRHQLNVLQRTAKRPHLQASDRAFRDLLSRFWSCWKQSLVIVQPETVIGWQREGSGCIGDGSADRMYRGGQEPRRMSVSQSGRCQKPMFSGVLRVSTGNC
jgi:hypothetical protein